MQKNFKRFFQACDNLKPYYPFTINKLDDDTIVEHLDQLSFRFIITIINHKTKRFIVGFLRMT